MNMNGFHYNRNSGSHSIYLNDKGIHISIPKSLSCVVISRVIKQYNLKLI